MFLKIKSFYKGQRGLCSCGAFFVLDESQGQSCKTIRCPKCGATYGNLEYDDMLPWQHSPTSSHEVLNVAYKKLTSRNNVMFSVEEQGENLIVYKERPENFSENGGVEKWQSLEIEVSFMPTPKVVRIREGGQELSVTKSAIKRAAAGIELSRFTKACNESVGAFLDYVGQCIESSALSQVLLSMIEYPVFESAYRGNGTPMKPQYIKEAIDKKVVVPYERSETKAFGLSNPLCRACHREEVSIVRAASLTKTYGPDKSLVGIKAALEVTGPDLSNVLGLPELMCELSGENRRRLLRYLTNDVDIYQGIESPIQAWNILLDYRSMCLDMDTKPDLCPKSLKLQHDLATKNYKLVLDERQCQLFCEAVQDKEYRRLEWISKDQKWMVSNPKVPNDLIEEGRKQNHCVGSYVKYVCNHVFRVCFLRNTSNPDKPVLTLTVDQNDCCLYYKGVNNRPPRKHEMEILTEWANAKKLTLGNG